VHRGRRRGGRRDRLRRPSGRRTVLGRDWLLARPALLGRGIATEALRAVTAHAFRVHGLHRLFALPYAGNAASCRVLEKAGYRLEGRLREHPFKDGRFVDQLLYAIVDDGGASARAPGGGA